VARMKPRNEQPCILGHFEHERSTYETEPLAHLRGSALSARSMHSSTMAAMGYTPVVRMRLPESQK
jgi:hypothetical protein